MARSWYVLQTYSQFEKKVEKNIRQLMENPQNSKNILDVKVPIEKIIENRNGKKREKEVRIWPGYILLELDLDCENWKEIVGQIKCINGVNGFVGAEGNTKPNPISNDEVKAILMRTGEIKADKSLLIQTLFRQGENVRITEGPFTGFTGTIEEINSEKKKLRIMVGIFGRSTPVEMDFNQVEKV